MLTALDTARISARGVSLKVWQDGFEPAITAGNKRFKLNAVFDDVARMGLTGVVTFGGAWSNHIHAIAFQAQQRGLASKGIIRGTHVDAGNATLSDARRFGMNLQFVSREDYRKRHSESYLSLLRSRHPTMLIVPEGGSTLSAASACGAILDEIDPAVASNLHTVTCAVGTGATLCGVHQRLPGHQYARGYAVVKDPSRRDNMLQWSGQGPSVEPRVISVYQPPYGKLDSSLLRFIDEFYLEHKILLDPLYTSKMMQKLLQEIDNGEFPAGASILALHTGGLQGWRGFQTQARKSLSTETCSAIKASGA